MSSQILGSGADKRNKLKVSDKLSIPPPLLSPSASAPTASAPARQAFDLSKLSDESFDVEKCISYSQDVRQMLQKLANEEAVNQLQSALADAKDTTAQELQKNVFHNYNEFVVISKEITKLEGDMISVRQVLNEIKEVRDTIGLTDGICSLEVIKANDIAPGISSYDQERVESDAKTKIIMMKSLYKDIDGLQKGLSDLQDRQLVYDGSAIRLWHVNASTYKQKEVAVIYILTDTMVIASWKKNLISGKNRLAVEKIFSINEIGFIDMKDSPEMNNAFKIIKGSETFMFRAETIQEKRALLAAITKITGEILAIKKQKLGIRKSMNDILLSPTSGIPKILKVNEKQEMKEGLKNPDFRWLSDLPDELDVLIAHRDFGQAITHIEKARQLFSFYVDDAARLKYLRVSIDERVTTISRLVSIDLTSPAAIKSQIQEDIQRLLRLGLGDQARDIYLTTRTANIRHKLRELQFSGDIEVFIYDYAEVFFRLIKNTCEWFSVSFHDPSMASGFMSWIDKELNYFTKTFRKQIFGMDHEFAIIAVCIVSAFDRCQELNKVGMDISFLFENLIREDVVIAIESYYKRCDDDLFQFVHEDQFERLMPEDDIFVSENTQLCDNY